MLPSGRLRPYLKIIDKAGMANTLAYFFCPFFRDEKSFLTLTRPINVCLRCKEDYLRVISIFQVSML